MLISIIVPVYNSEKYLERCLKSIIKQTYKELEIILIDDGSTDMSNQICKDYMKLDNRIKLITTKNMGVSNARNLGLDVAKGEYISFIDSDDKVDERFIEKMYYFCEKYKTELACVNMNYYFGNNVTKPLKIKGGIIDKNEYYKQLICNIKGFVCNKLYHKSLINNIRFDTNISVCEDLLFNIKIAKYINKVCVINEFLYDYYQNSTSTYNGEYNSKKITEIFAYDKIINLLQLECPEILELYKYEYLLMAIRQKNKYKNSKYRDKNNYEIIRKSVSKYYMEVLFSRKIKLNRKIYIILNDRFPAFIVILKKIKNKEVLKCLV